MTVKKLLKCISNNASTIQVQYTFFQFRRVSENPGSMAHSEVLPTWQSLQADINAGWGSIGLRKYNDSFLCIGHSALNIQADKF